MTTIDQAFVKAFAKERTRPAVPPGVSVAADDDSSGDPTMMWIDAAHDQYHRRDPSHPNPGPHPSRPRGGQPTGPPTPATGQGGSAAVGAPNAETTASDTPWSPDAAPGDGWDPGLFAPITIEAQHFGDFLPAAPPTSPVQPTPPTPTPPAPTTSPAAEPKLPAAEPLAAISAEPPAAPSQPFEAAWEVDRFELPDVVLRLMTQGDLLNAAGVPLTEACRAGLKTLLVTSPDRGQGKTSIAMGLALSVASRGLRVALIDGDCRTPALADRFRLDIQFGWIEAIRGGWSLEESAVHSIEDGLTLLPLVPSDHGQDVAGDELAAAVAALRQRFDLVIVDAGSSADGWPLPVPRQTVDAALVIRDLRADDEQRLTVCVASLRDAGISSIGLAENFAS